MPWKSRLQEAFLFASFCNRNQGLRSEIDEREDTIGSKIRDAQLQKVPYMLAVGKNEIESGRLNVRDRKGKLVMMNIDEFIKHVKSMVKERSQIE